MTDEANLEMKSVSDLGMAHHGAVQQEVDYWVCSLVLEGQSWPGLYGPITALF